MIDIGDIDVVLGLDVGKGERYATAVTPAGEKAFDKRLPNTEPKLRELFAKLQAKHGTVLVVADQPASIGALPLAVARDMGCPVAYLPGLTMRRIADLYPGEAKTDARDAFIIADAATAMPHTLRAIDGEDETIAELGMIVGFDDDLAGQATRVANRLRGLLTQIHPSLERVLGPRLQHPAVLTLLERFGSPAQIRKAGRRRLVTLLRPKAPRMAERLVDEIFAALDEQTVTVPGTEAVALIVPSLAASLTAVLDQRRLLAGPAGRCRSTPGAPVRVAGPLTGASLTARGKASGRVEPCEAVVFPLGPPPYPTGIQRGAVADVQAGRVEGEHLAQAGEVLPGVVVEGRIGGPAGDEAHEGAGDQVAGDEVTVVCEDGDRSGGVAGGGHDARREAEVLQARLAADEHRGLEGLGPNVEIAVAGHETAHQAGGQIRFADPARAIRSEVGDVAGEGRAGEPVQFGGRAEVVDVAVGDDDQ
ncbi:hypothetical protein GCM10010503_39440 [Streptomyces lucensis JCM 4490]|uniref:Transposase IS110-like N-terminal domain-containing protein n=1 Tax=Streptomyces lucensis JCM 4490 TaxID=1306176 RepID=A0A918J841_9ACTN|nr:hypothetical protein GCM10010503_39440 [Streptomyces lucensis JCM 4490]